MTLMPYFYWWWHLCLTSIDGDTYILLILMLTLMSYLWWQVTLAACWQVRRHVRDQEVSLVECHRRRQRDFSVANAVLPSGLAGRSYPERCCRQCSGSLDRCIMGRKQSCQSGLMTQFLLICCHGNIDSFIFMYIHTHMPYIPYMIL